MSRDWRHRISLTLYCAIAIVGSFLLLHLVPWLPTRITVQGRDFDRLFDGMLALVAVVFGIVLGAVVYSIVHFRDRGDGREPRPTRANRTLEVAWIALPLACLCALSFVSYLVLHGQEAAPARGATVLHVQVRGQRFAWLFSYPDLGVTLSPQLVLPEDELVEFDATSIDVIHSFWVPEARVKEDAVPGRVTHVQWTPDRTGTWWVVCAELCGPGHSHMRAKLTVLSRGDFNAWIAAHRDGAPVQTIGPGTDTPPGGIGLEPGAAR